MPLYSRVGNKDALVDAIADRLLADLAPARGGRAVERVRRPLGAVPRDGVRRARDSRLVVWPGREAYVEASRPLVDVLRRDGFAPDAAVQACRLLTWATVGFGAVESGVEPPRSSRRRRSRPGSDPSEVDRPRPTRCSTSRSATWCRASQGGASMTIPTLDATGKVVVVTGGEQGPRTGRWPWASPRPERTWWWPAASSMRARRWPRRCGRSEAESSALACHVGDWDQCAALVQRTVEEHGRIDVLVNNAGIAPVPPSLAGVTVELFDKTIAVNLRGPLRLTALAAEHMPSGGSIINVSSKAALTRAVHRRLRRGQGRAQRL